MEWNDTAIILSSRKYGENSALLRVFTRAHGVHAGIVRGANSKTNRGVLQAGNIVNAAWHARLPEQLGSLKLELLVPNAALCMAEPARLCALVSACTLVEATLPERHPYERLYRQMLLLLEALEHNPDWQQSYVHFELAILAECGFGLDLSRCAATGASEQLAYVSPKTGRAVSLNAGLPYHDRMLPLPAFLTGTLAPTCEEILAGARLTGYFLESWLLTPHRKKLPAARNRLIQTLETTLENTLKHTLHAAETASA